MPILMLLWFIGSGRYIEPISVTGQACGKPVVASFQTDREVNPTKARWADCDVDIQARLATLEPGVYHLAATGVGSYNAPDPHTSAAFIVSPDFEPPTEQVPAVRSFAWLLDAPVAIAQAYRIELELDGVLQPTPLAQTCVASPTLTASCSAPVPSVTPTKHTARIRAVDASLSPAAVAEWSDPLVFITPPPKATGFGIKP